MESQTFKSRFGLIAALIGMAVGTGNIWRFPRVLAANGGAAFLIPWFLFLFLWSIPLLIVEFSCGQRLRRGVTGCFSFLTGGRYTWLGAFVVFCTLGIMFYYSAVTGWCAHYLIQSVTGRILKEDPRVFWEAFSGHSRSPFFLHVAMMLLTAFVLAKGVRRGIEALSVFMMPALFVILILLAGYVLTFEGSLQGLRYMFEPDFSKLAGSRIWLEGLTQSAWSTGAGWGIALSYACYARSHDDAVLTPFTTGLGNNSVELLAGLVIVPALFSFFSLPEALEIAGSGNTGLTFITLPGLFQKIPFGQLAAILFFTGLFFAAFSSLVSMAELGVRFFQDLGWPRARALAAVTVLGIAMGAPSALNAAFLENQDWVWGIGLLVSGFFFSLLMHHVGMERFCRELLPIRSPVHRRFFQIIVFWLIPAEFLALVGWWFYQAMTWDSAGWWNPLKPLSIGTCLVQWGVLLAVLFLSNGFLNQRVNGKATS